MPTGYTDKVGKGEITDFKEYALLCARNFGACIMLRDEPLSSEIPEFQPSRYHIEKIDEITNEIEWIRHASDDELQAKAEQEFTEEARRCEEQIAASEKTVANYEAMLEKARQYKPPTSEHENYAKFLVDQLTESIKFDDMRDYYRENYPKRKTAREYRDDRVRKLYRDLAYHKQEQVKEEERTDGRNRWVNELKESLGIEVPNAA